jgi:hypothetical protein
MNELCLELRCNEGFPIEAGHYFETRLPAAPGDSLSFSGRDEYRLSTRLPSGSRIAGFGRFAAYTVSSLLEAAPSMPLPVTGGRLSFYLSTNAILSPGLLGQIILLRVSDSRKRSWDIALHSAAAAIEWKSRGQYIISLRLRALS